MYGKNIISIYLPKKIALIISSLDIYSIYMEANLVTWLDQKKRNIVIGW